MRTKKKKLTFLYATTFHTTKAMLLLLLLSPFSRVRLCATPGTAAHQAPPSLGFSRQEHWSGVPLPSLNQRGSYANKFDMKSKLGNDWQNYSLELCFHSLSSLTICLGSKDLP